MNNLPDTQATHSPVAWWRRSRYGFVICWIATLLVFWGLLRLSLLLSLRVPAPFSTGELVRAFAHGLHRDFLVAVAYSLPLLGWFLICPQKWFGRRWHRGTFWGIMLVFWATQVFLLAVEYFFFDEFHSRFNTVAVDYLIYPDEVFINIWDSYPVVWIIASCTVLGGVWVLAAMRLFRPIWQTWVPLPTRLAWFAGAALLCVGLSQTVHLRAPEASTNRELNEIANNGPLSFVGAFFTRHLDYAAFYRTIPRDEAYQRTRRILTEPGSEFVTGGDSTLRRVAGDPAKPKLNVVILLEESLGSEFFGCLGRPGESLTPEMDRLALHESLLFTNIYASGNRTIRGMEGVLSSFPPLPGDSIVARDMSENVETIARVLKRDGYETLFVYGGRGLFDGMRRFTLANGYDRFIEEKHFDHPTFATIWGVCDEDLFARTIAECRELTESGKPFLVTALSVSNHKPYTYPKGRIPEDPEIRRREHAVKYSDYALGQFFKAAKQESFWTNTVFVVVADHGARVYGSQTIPIHSYEIPLIITGPAVVKTPAKLGMLGCSLDVPTTILGLIGRPYESLFFGRDLLKSSDSPGYVWINHNRDVGLYSNDRLVVLGLQKHVEFYAGDPKQVDLAPLTTLTTREEELERDATAIFQVADDLYTSRRYRIDPK